MPTRVTLKGLRILYVQTIFKIGLLGKVTEAELIKLKTAAFKMDSKAKALNRKNSPNSSLWILIIIPGFTYMLSHNLELVEKGL